MLFILYWHCYMKSEEKCTGFLWKIETLSLELYNFICPNIPANSRHNTEDGSNWELQSWTKVLRHFSKTNAFELTIVLLFLNENTFFIYSHHPPPQTMLQNASLIFTCFQYWKSGKGRLPFTRAESRIHNWGKYYVSFHVSTTFVHDWNKAEGFDCQRP